MSIRLPLTALGLSLALGLPAAAHEASKFRLFVADHATGRVTVLDLDDPAQRESFDLTGPARLYTMPGEGLVAAVQSDADRVDFLRSGIALSDHGDHSDLEIAAPGLIETPLTGPYPVHVVAHSGQIAVAFDNGGYAQILPQAEIAEGKIEGWAFKHNHPHHGFTGVMGGLIVSTLASDQAPEGDASRARFGLGLFNADGSPVGEPAACTAIHGEAFSGAYLAAGCKEGVLILRIEGTGNEATAITAMLPYPADFPEGTTGTLKGVGPVQMFLGNHGPDGLVVIDPEAGEMTRIALPFRRVDFTLDPARAQFAYALTEDGSLHRIDLLAACIDASAKVTAPYSMDGHWSDPRPRLAVAQGEVLITDPLAGTVHRVDADSLAVTGDIAIEGMPFALTVAGGSGMMH